MTRKILLVLANLLLLAVIAGIVWATLLPVIWGPNPDATSEFGLRRERR